MGRIEPITGNTSIEIMAPMVNLSWDPVTNGGSVTFNTAKYVVVDGVIRQDIAPAYGGMLYTDLANIITRCFMIAGTLNDLGQDISIDPVTGADLSQISTYGLMNLVKAAFNVLHDEQQLPSPDPLMTGPTVEPTSDPVGA